MNLVIRCRLTDLEVLNIASAMADEAYMSTVHLRLGTVRGGAPWDRGPQVEHPLLPLMGDALLDLQRAIYVYRSLLLGEDIVPIPECTGEEYPGELVW
jgi:hypothetical protein